MAGCIASSVFNWFIMTPISLQLGRFQQAPLVDYSPNVINLTMLSAQGIAFVIVLIWVY